jgi:hypothetical protein
MLLITSLSLRLASAMPMVKSWASMKENSIALVKSWASMKENSIALNEARKKWKGVHRCAFDTDLIRANNAGSSRVSTW